MAESENASGKEEKPSGPSTPKGPLILALLNIIGAGAVLGLYFYSKMVFKRPPITEQQERKRIKATASKLHHEEGTKTITLQFGPIKANIIPSSEGRLHFLNLSFTLEIYDIDDKERFNELQAVFLDRLLTLLATKSLSEVNSVQGRYILRSQMMELIHDLILESKTTGDEQAPPLVKNVFITDFQVQ